MKILLLALLCAFVTLGLCSRCQKGSRRWGGGSRSAIVCTGPSSWIRPRPNRPVYGNDRNPETGEHFSRAFYPLSAFISSFFVFFTIITYIIIKDLREKIFGKLTMGYLINVFIAYFTAGIVHSWNYFDQEQTYKGTRGCMVLGYIIQHTYVAILFWTNAMAFTLVNTFSNVLLQSVERDETVQDRKKVILSSIYGQGKTRN